LNATSNFNRFRTVSGFRNLKATKGEILDKHLPSVLSIINDKD
jgi:hypothetical protein